MIKMLKKLISSAVIVPWLFSCAYAKNIYEGNFTVGEKQTVETVSHKISKEFPGLGKFVWHFEKSVDDTNIAATADSAVTITVRKNNPEETTIAHEFAHKLTNFLPQYRPQRTIDFVKEWMELNQEAYQHYSPVGKNFHEIKNDWNAGKIKGFVSLYGLIGRLNYQDECRQIVAKWGNTKSAINGMQSLLDMVEYMGGNATAEQEKLDDLIHQKKVDKAAHGYYAVGDDMADTFVETIYNNNEPADAIIRKKKELLEDYLNKYWK